MSTCLSSVTTWECADRSPKNLFQVDVVRAYLSNIQMLVCIRLPYDNCLVLQLHHVPPVPSGLFVGR